MTPHVHLDQDLFGDLDPSTPGRIQDSSLLVEADDEPAAAVVLRRAAWRLRAVTGEGVELLSEANWEAH